MIKALNDKAIKKITELGNPVYDTGYLPPDMSSSIFVRLPKKAKAIDSTGIIRPKLTVHGTKCSISS